jgi:hypothetical protein
MGAIKRNGWRLDDDFSALERRITTGSARVVDDTARAILSGSKPPVDTSSLQVSGYVHSPLRNDAAKARASARSANPQVELEEPFDISGYADDDITVAVVDYLALHASLIHDGHFNIFAGRYITGRPFLATAVRNQKDDFEKRVALFALSLRFDTSK